MTIGLVTIHRWLASLLAVFIMMHLAVHLSGLAGADVHLKTLELVRPFYRNALIEPILVITVLIQVCLGMRLAWARRKQKSKGFWGWVQIISGFYLGIFLINHFAAAIYTYYGIGLDTNFYWAAGTLTSHRLPWLFMPYYFFAIVSLFAHLAAALYYNDVLKHKGAVALLVCGALLAVLIEAIFMGAFYEINLPDRYQNYYKTYLIN